MLDYFGRFISPRKISTVVPIQKANRRRSVSSTSFDAPSAKLQSQVALINCLKEMEVLRKHMDTTAYDELQKMYKSLEKEYGKLYRQNRELEMKNLILTKKNNKYLQELERKDKHQLYLYPIMQEGQGQEQLFRNPARTVPRF